MIAPDLQKRISIALRPLNSQGATNRFPPVGALAAALEAKAPGKRTSATVLVNPDVATLFCTAAIDMWHRAVHSFLISAASTEVSPIWASIGGYYSSHYAVRALAHLLGYFQLHRRKLIVQIKLQNGTHICDFSTKSSGDREHRVYWKVVKADSHFSGDPLFTVNDGALDVSDVGHRDRANYVDHLSPKIPPFNPANITQLKARIDQISDISFTAPPIPDRTKFPDLESVQAVSYHRIVRFRSFMDDALGGSNRYWSYHRNPGFTGGMVDFQLAPQGSPATVMLLS